MTKLATHPAAAPLRPPELERLRSENAEQRRELERLRAELARLRHQVDLLRISNDELGREKRRLRASLDTYVARAQVGRLFGPLELTAGTHVGPRRHDARRDQDGDPDQGGVTRRDRGLTRHPHR